MRLNDLSLDYTLIAALILTAIHFCGPVIRRSLRRRAELVASFGGGVAVAYVFLSLFPEIELAHEWLGDTVHAVTLFSFLFFYGLEVWLLAHRRQPNRESAIPVSGGDHLEDGHHSARVFWWHIVLSWFYTAMVIFALPEESSQDLGFAIVGSLAVGLHLIYKDYVLHSHHQEGFEERGRYVLAGAPMAGWLAHQLMDPSEAVFDVFVAVIAGILMQGVFRDEVPQMRAVRLNWMVGGATTFTVLTLLTG